MYTTHHPSFVQDIREEFTEESVEATSFVRTLKAPSTKKKGDGTRIDVIASERCCDNSKKE